jgi:hypothetical protein
MGPALVLEVEESGSFIQVQVENDYQISEIRVRKAISTEINPGDTVLILGENPDNIYIIGILEQKELHESSKSRIILEGGTHATRVGESLRVFSRKRELLFEYDEKNGKAKINLDSGDIEFITRNGNINFAASKDILLNGQTIGITSRSGTIVGTTDSQGQINSALSLSKDELSIESQTIGMKAQKGDLQISDTAFTGDKINANIGFVKFFTDRIETFAQTIKSTAKNVYKTVEELYQLKSGRMRTLVKSTFHLKSKKSMLKSDDDFKVRAEKIHLG